MLAVAGASLVGREIARRTSRELRVTFLDVGQGDAAVVEAPGGRVALIDGGGTVDGSFDPGARVIEPFLRARGIGRVDLVVLSHAHPDHLNGLLRVLARFPVTALWTNGEGGHNPTYDALMALAHARGVTAPPPGPTRLGPVDLAPLGPWLDDRIAAPPGTGVNDGSLVVRAGYAGRSLLFAGDIEGDGEAELVGRAAAGLVARSDVLKVPHHGSRTSSSPELVDVVSPQLAVMSLGWLNRFQFPHREVLARYAARGVRVLRTDRDGAVTVTIDEGGRISATCARGCR
jgi:competence protein ComEC